MSDITITIDGLSELLASLEAIKARVDTATRYATRDSGKQLQSDARHNFSGSHAPGFWHTGGNQPNTVTGNLQASILSTPVVQQGRAKYATRVAPHAIYSRVIEFGAHIDVKTAKYLHWFDAQFQVDRYKKSVDIPPYPYFRPARMTLPPKMEQIFALAWRGAWHGR